MSIRRKRSDLPLGPSRALGVQGVRVVNLQSNRQGTSTDPAVTYVSAQRGDLILALGYASGGTTYSVTASGLTFTTVSSTTYNSQRLHIAHAWSPDTASRQVTFANDGSSTALVVLVLRGVDPVSPVDVSPTHTAHAAANSFTVPSIDTVTARAFGVLLVGSSDDNTLTAAAPWTATDVANIETYRAFGVWTRTVAAAGAIGTTDITETANGPDTAHSAVFAIRALAG